MPLDTIVARGIAAIALWSSRNSKTVVAAVVAATLVLGYGTTLITTNVDVADVLPRGDPNTAAAHNLTQQFRSTFTQQVTLQLHVDEATGFENWARDNERLQYRYLGLPVPVQPTPGRPIGPWTVQPDPHNITDEVYVRAMEEMIDFFQERTDFTRTISVSKLYTLINWTLAGGERRAQETDFALPGYATPDEAIHYHLVDQTVKAAIPDAVAAITSPSWNHGVALFMPPSDSEEHMRVLGEQMLAARDAYVAAVAAGETEFTVFGPDNPPLFTVDFPIANAHSSRLVEEDTMRLMGAVAAFILACLFLAFRNIRAVAVSFTTLGIGVVWTYGVMGYMGIALNTLNMTIVPLIMGVGIDYAIHMINEFIEHKAEGLTDAQAFQNAGGRAGLAMFIATLTTCLGLVVMMVSPSLLMAQLGFLSAVAIASVYILTITFIPAALTLVGQSKRMGQSFTPSRIMPFLARGVTRGRIAVIILVAGLTVGAVLSSQTLAPEAFGDPGKNFPQGHFLYGDDPIREEHEQGLRYFYEMEDPDVKANILTFEGPGILTPEAMEYYRTIERNLMTKDRVIADTLRTLPFFIETWLTVKGGPEGAIQYIGLEALLETGLLPGPVQGETQPFPTTEEGIRAEVDGMFQSPMRELSALIINHPTLNMAAMTFSVRADTFEDAAEVWEQVWDAVEQANLQYGGSPPEGVHVAFVGNTATNYLFIEQQLPWLTYMAITATIILAILVAAFTRNLKATLATTAMAMATSIWWLGTLPFLGIGLAITLMLPLVFIFNIGTDYAVHVIWNIRQVGNTRAVFETVGKAVLFSAITTAGAFLVFTLVQNVAVARTMMATTVAILVIFLATLLIVPVFYGVKAKPAGPGPGERPPAAGTGATAPLPAQQEQPQRTKGGTP